MVAADSNTAKQQIVNVSKEELLLLDLPIQQLQNQVERGAASMGSQDMLAGNYEDGENSGHSTKLFRLRLLAANQGYTNSQFNLGVM
jgi:hypothetical protein